MQSLWFIAFSILTGVLGQTLIKLGVSQPNGAKATPGLLALLTQIIQSPLILGGLVLYGVGALAWIAVLKRLPLSTAYPFLALNFVLIALISQILLGETMPLMRWWGIGFICIGIFLVARSMATG